MRINATTCAAACGVTFKTRSRRMAVLGAVLALLVLSAATLTGGPVRAVPLFTAVDLDPLTPGIQSSLTVAPGTTFTVDVVLDDLGLGAATSFDLVLLDVLFNDAGLVLGLTPATTPIAGALAALPGTADAASAVPILVAPGSPLAVGPSLALAPPFTSSLGGVGLFNPTSFLSFALASPPSIFSLSIDALMSGTSSIFAPGAVPGSELTLGNAGPGTFPPTGTPVEFPTLLSATVTVTPEPTTLALFAFGLAGLGLVARRRART